jgi:heme o synthase
MSDNLLLNLFELTKPRLSSLVIFTAAGGWWLAPTSLSWEIGLLAVTGTTITVASANILNNYLERESDKHMTRTQDRALPTGRVSPKIALLTGFLLTALAIPALTILVHPLPALLAAVALVSYVLLYTPMKRHSSFNTLIGAIPGAMPPLIGWTAATHSIDIGGLLLFALMFVWQIPHFLAIAIYRKQEYENAGLIMLPSEQGLEVTRRQILLYTFVLFPIPILLMFSQVSGILTCVIGTIVGGWWLWQAIDGYKNKREHVWARKFFMTSLYYLTTLFIVITIDGILA